MSIEGLIEAVTPDGVVHGWVRDTAHAAAVQVEVMLAGQVLAACLADRFRPDLLARGHGHGHHGFAAMLRRPLPAGANTVVMHLPRQAMHATMRLAVPELNPPRVRTVEDLLVEPPGWTTADLLAYPACLDLDAEHTRLGSLAFIDAVFRFVLSRWPSRAEAAMNADSLRAGRITPAGLLLDCLGSRERRDMGDRLPSPFDPDFPFAGATG